MSRRHANLLLLLAAIFWGCGNVAQKTVLDHLDPLSAAGLRCLIAAVLVAPFIATERRIGGVPGWRVSVLRVGVLFAAALGVQQAAFLGTSVTNASFLVNTATVMTPLAAWCLLGERPGGRAATAAGLTLAGALLLCGGFSGTIGVGDRAAVLSAAFYALWIVELARHARAHGRPFATATAQFALAALLLLPAGVLQGELTAGAAWRAGPELAGLGVFSTALAFSLHTVAQRFTSACDAAIIVSAESVFGAVAAALVLGERISMSGAAGGALVLAAIGLVTIPAGERRQWRPWHKQASTFHLGDQFGSPEATSPQRN